MNGANWNRLPHDWRKLQHYEPRLVQITKLSPTIGANYKTTPHDWRKLEYTIDNPMIVSRKLCTLEDLYTVLGFCRVGFENVGDAERPRRPDKNK